MGLGLFITEGIYYWLTQGSVIFDLIPTIETLPTFPSSAILFGIFGLVIFTKWKVYSPLVLGATWALWESFYKISEILSTNSLFYQGAAPLLFFAIWTQLILMFLWVAKPKFNFTNWSAVLLFVFYNNTRDILTTGQVIEPISEIIFFLFVWKSFIPNVSIPKINTQNALQWCEPT